MTLRFAVVYEHSHDMEIATHLADRVLCQSIDWLEEIIDHRRTWIAHDPELLPLTWSGIKKSASRAGVRAHGHMPEGPAAPQAVATRRALEYLLKVYGELDAVLFIVDRDNKPDRLVGLRQARDEHLAVKSRPVVIVGIAIPEREAWVLAGFEPRDAEEQARLEQLRDELSFHPCEQSHRLRAGGDDTAKFSPKRVLGILTEASIEREQRCWQETPLDVLRKRGGENGLADYLSEVQAYLVEPVGRG
jgi:hypothetical protein